MINRVASEIRGRTSPHYQNQIAKVQHGDICVIVNIEDPLVTGKKLLFKKLRYHTGFIGHLKEYSYKHVLNHKPELLVRVS
jgi:large subunit ribosomal protein L13